MGWARINALRTTLRATRRIDLRLAPKSLRQSRRGDIWDHRLSLGEAYRYGSGKAQIHWYLNGGVIGNASFGGASGSPKNLSGYERLA